jgi:hypothetical protein
MPAWIKTSRDESKWAEAKKAAHKSYPHLSEERDKFWKLTTSIYKKMGGKIR